VFADRVLIRLTILFAFMALIAMSAVASAILLKVIGMATPGWMTEVLGFSTLLFLQTGMSALVALLIHGAVRPESPETVCARAQEFIYAEERVPPLLREVRG
jgi:polyisoprenyl-phosphate glycosyltransferase